MAINKKQSFGHSATLDVMSDEFLPEHPESSVSHTRLGDAYPGSLMDRMGMELLEHSAQRTVIRMPVSGNTQRMGILHGGASAALVETAGSMAASASIRDDNHMAVGVELNISHLRTVADGFIYATATAEHLGRTSTVHMVRVTDQANRLIATARISNRIILASR